MKRQSKRVLLMSILIVCAMAAVLVGFVLPLSSTKILTMKVTFTGIDYIRLIGSLKDMGAVVNYPGMMVYIALIIAALGLLAGGISAVVRKRGMLVITLILALGSAVSMFLFLWEALETVGIGFYLFMAGNALAVIFSIIGFIPVKAENWKPETTAPVAEAVPVSIPAPRTAFTVCSKCGGQQPGDAKFCRACGTPVTQGSAATMPKQELGNVCPKCGRQLHEGAKFCRACGTPVTREPAPTVPKLERGNVCRKCGTGLVAEAKICAVCATPVVEVSPDDDRCSQCGAELKPGASFCVRCATPVMVPVRESVNLGESERRAICPYCGTRQSARNLRCKSCGNAMR